MFQPDDWLTDSNGARRWMGDFDHPELADLARRLRHLMLSARLSPAEGEVVCRVERVLCIARDWYGWWFCTQMSAERLLPDAPGRPDVSEIDGVMPSWETFALVLGALHRCRDWIERVERKHGIEMPSIASVIAAAYGLSEEDAA